MPDLQIIYLGLFLVIMFIPTIILSIKTSVGTNTISSQFFILILMYIVLSLPSYAIGLFFSILSVGILYEIFNCLHQYDASIKLLTIKIISYGILPLIPILFIHNPVFVFILITGYWLLCAVHWTFNQKINEAIIEITTIQLALFSIVSLSLLPLLSVRPRGNSLCLYIFFLTNISDLTALLGGKIFGKRKLVTKISPNKTIAGALIALFSCIVISFIFNFILKLSFSTYQSILIGLLVGFFAQIGDLFSSLFKRYLGIKDYGNFIPGHGGILDRMDSSIFTVPFFLALLLTLDYL